MAVTRGQLQVQFLKSVLGAGGRIIEAHFSVQHGLTGRSGAMYSLTLEQQGVRSLQELQWSSQLERYLLVEARLKMASPEEDAERFATILQNNLAAVETDTGKDFADAVLVAVLRERPHYALGDVLERTGAVVSSTGSSRYEACATLVRQSIDGLHNTAQLELGYAPGPTLTLMQQALRIVLDETFHLATSERLFPRN